MLLSWLSLCFQTLIPILLCTPSPGNGSFLGQWKLFYRNKEFKVHTNDRPLHWIHDAWVSRTDVAVAPRSC